MSSDHQHTTESTDAGPWVAIDFETANGNHSSACSVGLITVQDGCVIDRFHSLIKPPPEVGHFNAGNMNTHGITPDDVVDAPPLHAVLGRIFEFVSGRPLVAHNASTERSIIEQACQLAGIPAPDLRIACTVDIAKKTWELDNYKLKTVSQAVNRRLDNHHDALADAEAAAHVAMAALRHHGHTDLASLLSSLRMDWHQVREGSALSPRTTRPPRSTTWDRYAARQGPLPAPNPDADPSHPLHGKIVCFTGELDSMERNEACAAVALAGAQPAKNVTLKTQFLVVGKQDPDTLAPGQSKSKAHSKAEEYRSRSGINIIDEARFLLLLERT